MAAMDTLLIVFLTLLNGVFAMSEMALAASRKARLVAMEEAGDKGAGAALQLLAQPTQFLSTVQVGITSIGMLNGIVGEAAYSAALARTLEGWGMAAPAAGISATALVVTAITFVTIIFGELVPKRIGQLYPEVVARWVARPMAGLARAAGYRHVHEFSELNDFAARIGSVLNEEGPVFAALKVEGVSNVALPQPATDIEISDSECANNVGTMITVVGRGQ